MAIIKAKSVNGQWRYLLFCPANIRSCPVMNLDGRANPPGVLNTLPGSVVRVAVVFVDFNSDGICDY